MARQRRVKLLCLSIDVITELLNWWKAPLTRMVRIPKIPDAPDDVEVEFIFPDYVRQCYFARLYHPTWDEVPDGAMAPELTGIATEFVTVGRGDAVDTSWRTTVENLNRERDEQLAAKDKEIEYFRRLVDAKDLLSVPREQHVSDVSADLMRKMGELESKESRYAQQQKLIDRFAELSSAPELSRTELDRFIASHGQPICDDKCLYDAISWLRKCAADIDRLTLEATRGKSDSLPPVEPTTAFDRRLLECLLAASAFTDQSAVYWLENLLKEIDRLRVAAAPKESPAANAKDSVGPTFARWSVEAFIGVSKHCKHVSSSEARELLESCLSEIDRLGDELALRKATMIIEGGSLGEMLGVPPSPPDAPAYPRAFPTDMPF